MAVTGKEGLYVVKNGSGKVTLSPDELGAYIIAQINAGNTNFTLSPASTTQTGVVKQMTFTAQLSAAPTQADFNNLLTKLIGAGLMKSS